MLEFRALGPIEVVRDGQPVELPKGSERALLAVLVLEAGRAVSADRLIDALWGEPPPPTAPEMVRNYVGRVRARLGPDTVVTEASGYHLVVEPGALDIAEFERRAALGAAALEAGDSEQASQAFRSALALWRSRPLPELDDAPRYAARLRELEELHLRVEEDRVDAELALGRAAALVPDLETLAQEHPYRERLLGQLMLALYRSGRQKDALDRYTAVRRRLVDELGLEPGPDLRELQARILRHDTALDLPTRGVSAQPRPRRVRARVALPIGIAVLVAASAIAFAGGGANAVSVPAQGLVALVPSSGKLIAAAPLHVQPGPVVVDGDAVWVGSAQDAAAFKVAARRPGAPSRIRLPASPFSLAASGGSVWVGDGYLGSVSRIDPRSGRVTTFRPEPTSRGRLPLAADVRRLWIASQDGSLTQVDAVSGRRERTFRGIGEAESIVLGDGAVWAASATSDVVERFDPTAGRVVRRIPVGARPVELVAGEGAVWVLTADGHLWRVDPHTNGVDLSLALPGGTTTLATTPGRVWAGSDDGLVTEVNGATGTITRTIPLGQRIDALANGNGRIWAAVG